MLRYYELSSVFRISLCSTELTLYAITPIARE